MDEVTRRVDRERILSLLYEAEIKEAPASEILAQLTVAPDEFVTTTVEGVLKEPEVLDGAIDRHSFSWSTDRMPSVDRNILRLGAWELMNRPDLPVAVVISEAVELAKRFSTEESGSFVNGVLSAIAGEVRQG